MRATHRIRVCSCNLENFIGSSLFLPRALCCWFCSRLNFSEHQQNNGKAACGKSNNRQRAVKKKWRKFRIRIVFACSCLGTLAFLQWMHTGNSREQQQGLSLKKKWYYGNRVELERWISLKEKRHFHRMCHKLLPASIVMLTFWEVREHFPANVENIEKSPVANKWVKERLCWVFADKLCLWSVNCWKHKM